jgi:hypothetical protein
MIFVSRETHLCFVSDFKTHLELTDFLLQSLVLLLFVFCFVEAGIGVDTNFIDALRLSRS